MAVVEKEEIEMSSREKSARERYLRLVYVDGKNKVVQKKKNGEWQQAHELQTDGSSSVDCSCPDSRIRGVKCYHQIAWEHWTFDEIVFQDGNRVKL